MPIYEYRCKKCGKIFEVLQKINEEPLTQCIECKSPVEKLISASSFQLKGSGWYLTDYSKGKPVNAPASKNPQKENTQNAEKK